MSHSQSADSPAADLLRSLDSRVKLLRSSPLWSSLSERTLRAIAVAMKPASLAFGDTLIHQGDQGSRLYAIVSGGVEVRLRTEGGETVVLAKLGQGECVGEMSLLTSDAASADVVAVNFVECLTLEREAFAALIAADQGILREIVRVISSRLKATDKAVGASVEREKRLSHFIKNEGETKPPVFLGRHPRMNALRQAIARHAQDSTPVFIQGEPGTGKETVARLIHAAGKRKAGPLLAVECAQIVESPWGDKLFGAYGQGGQSPEFFHAVCYMDLAEGGTLLLMDVDKLPKPIQQRLARFLSSEEWGPEGAPREVRVIVSSRIALERLASSGQLIGELAQAFKDRVVTVPSLCEHKKDIPELAWAFASEHASRLGKKLTGIDTQAVTKLVSYDYLFGNVRELKEAMERAVVLAEGELIGAEEVFLGVPAKQHSIGFNWLSLPRKLLAFLLGIPKAVRVVAALVFAAIFFDAFVGFQGSQGRLATLLVWSLWWPGLILSFLL
ncbi:MAG: sigma 54-interacting transcriptional regulator, partial [Elusimicrobiota bacterium]